MPTHEKNEPAALLAQIAAQYMDIPTLEARNRDSLDFHEVAVWQLKSALNAAYRAGIEAAAQND